MRRTTWRAPQEVVREINQVTRDWGSYFALGHDHWSFRQMNYFVAHRFRHWLWRKHGNPTEKYEKWPDKVLFEDYGIYQLRGNMA